MLMLGAATARIHDREPVGLCMGAVGLLCVSLGMALRRERVTRFAAASAEPFRWFLYACACAVTVLTVAVGVIGTLDAYQCSREIAAPEAGRPLVQISRSQASPRGEDRCFAAALELVLLATFIITLFAVRRDLRTLSNRPTHRKV